MDEANVIILASPVYVYHATGAMKAFLDHYGYRLFFWGVAKRYKYGVGVAAVDWNGVSEQKKKKIDKVTSRIAKKIGGIHSERIKSERIQTL